MKKTAGLYPAPLRIMKVIRAGLEEGQEEGYEAEAKVCMDERNTLLVGQPYI